MSPDEPTDEMPGGPEGPTEVNPPGDEPTEVTPAGAPTERLSTEGDRPTAALPKQGPESTEINPVAASSNKGIVVLIVSIIASVLLVGAYVAAGGPVGPDGAADPCDPRPWTDPGNTEEAAQQFALSAADGAACFLGVTREELTRSIGSDATRQQFMEEHGFTDVDLEEGLRAGLNRAVDDAENAGVIGGLAAAGIRAAIKLMPMSVMIGLLENADSVFNGDFSSLGGIGDAIDAITGGLDSLQSGSEGGSSGGLGGILEGVLPEGSSGALEEMLPEGTRRQLEKRAEDGLRQGLESLIGP